MNLLQIDELKTLIEQAESPCVSIYMPTHEAGQETQEDPIRLKNLLRRAEGQLQEMGMAAEKAGSLLKPASDLLLDSIFWRHQSDGLAIFVCPGFYRHYRLPLSFREVVIAGSHLHLKPLMPLFTGDGRFYVLAMSQNGTRILQGTRYSVRELRADELPASLAEVLRFDVAEKQLQFHTAPQARAGTGDAIYHGHGSGIDDAKHKKDLLRYVQAIDRGLQKMFATDKAPLVIAGVEYLQAIYREANSYPHLVPEGIAGSPDKLSARQLHERAWQIVEPIFTQGLDDAIGQYGRLAGTERASTDISTVLPAALQARNQYLFLAPNHQQWGRFDPQAGTVELHERPARGDEDLADLAAMYTLLNNGTVYAVDPGKLNNGHRIAAVFRY